MEGNQFHQALNRLMNDGDYRAAIKDTPRQLIEDYQLSLDDLKLISQVHVAATKEDPDVQGYTWEETLDDAWDWWCDNSCCG
jgi:hypothetical protein